MGKLNGYEAVSTFPSACATPQLTVWFGGAYFDLFYIKLPPGPLLGEIHLHINGYLKFLRKKINVNSAETKPNIYSTFPTRNNGATWGNILFLTL